MGIAALGQQPNVIRTESRTVLVDAVVTDKKGVYLHDLTAKDFHLWQDGKEQAISSVSLETKSTEKRFLVLFFDDTRMAPQDQVQARLAVSRFIDANSAPTRLMAVVSYSGALRIAQNFTDNAGRLKDALNRVEGSSRVIPGSTDRNAMAPAGDNLHSGNMIQALANLAKGLAVLPGRKTIVLLTAGVPSSSEMKYEVAAAVEASSRSDVAVYPIDVRPNSVAVDRVTDPFRPPPPMPDGSRIRLQGDDSTIVNQDAAGSSQPLLLALANGTGGFLIRDSSDLLDGLQQIGKEQTEYYVLSYTPPESKGGSCHTVRLKVDRGSARVRARGSYCDTKPMDLIPRTSVAEELEKRVAGADAGNLNAAVQLPYFYVSSGVARVHLAMEISPVGLKFENVKGKPHAEINLLGIATAPDGSIGARFSDTIKLDFNGPEIEKLKATHIHYEKEFKISPGTYGFSLAFASGGTSFGKVEAPLNVEPWSSARLALSSVALSRETRPAADLGLISSLVEDQTPMVAESIQFVPTGSKQFARTEEGFFYLELYCPDPESVTVQVRVLDRRTGEPRWDSGTTKLPAPSERNKHSIPAGASLRLKSLPAGSYRLEITASDADKGEAQRITDFEVQ
jgi:VWFA-related protein